MPTRAGAALAGLPTLLALAALAGLAGQAPQAEAAGRARTPLATTTGGPAYGQRADVAQFADEVAERRGLPRPWLLGQLAQARRVQAVRQLVMPPAAGTAKNWAAYRERFVEPRRIAAGLAFWRAQEPWLARAEERWGVPPEVVVAIVGVETFYGRVTGRFRTLDALATLAFDFPGGRKDRSPFFRSELEEFLVLCAREGVEPRSVKGSYAGAIGLAQFMPGSVNRFALDMDSDGRIDLQRDGADVVGSVAHFLAQAGWERDLPTHFAVAAPVDSRERAALLAPDITPQFTAVQFAEHGAVLDEAGQAHAGLLAFIELQNGEHAPSFVAGTRNFYALTRYNWSSYYAMAVIELARALRGGR